VLFFYDTAGANIEKVFIL